MSASLTYIIWVDFPVFPQAFHSFSCFLLSFPFDDFSMPLPSLNRGSRPSSSHTLITNQKSSHIQPRNGFTKLALLGLHFPSRFFSIAPTILNAWITDHTRDSSTPPPRRRDGIPIAPFGRNGGVHAVEARIRRPSGHNKSPPLWPYGRQLSRGAR